MVQKTGMWNSSYNITQQQPNQQQMVRAGSPVKNQILVGDAHHTDSESDSTEVNLNPSRIGGFRPVGNSFAVKNKQVRRTTYANIVYG